jgi:hypothetical protein
MDLIHSINILKTLLFRKRALLPFSGVFLMQTMAEVQKGDYVSKINSVHNSKARIQPFV